MVSDTGNTLSMAPKGSQKARDGLPQGTMRRRRGPSFFAEILRAFTGLILLPTFLVKLPADEYVASMAVGGEYVRLNGTSAVCFAASTSEDRQCRYLTQADCEDRGCLWANPGVEQCWEDDSIGAGKEKELLASCSSLSKARCNAIAGCTWTKALDLRIECRKKEPNTPFGGSRCEAVVANKPGALDAIRTEMQVLLTQVLGFGLGNMWLIQWYGTIDKAFQRGKPLVLGMFLLTAGAGSIRLNYFM